MLRHLGVRYVGHLHLTLIFFPRTRVTDIEKDPNSLSEDKNTDEEVKEGEKDDEEKDLVKEKDEMVQPECEEEKAPPIRRKSSLSIELPVGHGRPTPVEFFGQETECDASENELRDDAFNVLERRRSALQRKRFGRRSCLISK